MVGVVGVVGWGGVQVDADRRITAANCMRHPWVLRLRDGQTSKTALSGAQMKLRSAPLRRAWARRESVFVMDAARGGV